MTEVAVLGCGPAGLLVAHAVEQAGHTPHIVSVKQKSDIPGSQYFHEPIPDLTPQYPENTVQYVRMGTEEGYAEKVYGDPSRPTGWEAYNNVYPSWNVIKAYDILWDRFENQIHESRISPKALMSIALNFELVISTLPAQMICYTQTQHTFRGVPFWIKRLPLPPLDAERDIVIYNGRLEDSWYRWSILGGRCSIESTLPMQDAEQGRKAEWTNCDCFPGVIRAGRWAQWRHGVLLTHAYKTAVKALEKL